MSNAGPYILVETTNKADCRFFTAWLVKAAEAQEYWSQALCDADFADDVNRLLVMTVADLAAFALEIFGELERRHHVAVLDLYADENGVSVLNLQC